MILLLAAAGAYFSCSSPSSTPPNVLWITMDSFRADHLGGTTDGAVHTPTLDALATEGVNFTQCVAQAPYTHISVPSMITATYPYLLNIRQLGLPLDSARVTLAEALAEENYFTYGILEKWPQSYYQGFEKLDQGNSSTLQKTKWCLKALDEMDGRPFFIWLYYWDPHAPYTPPVEHMKIYEPDYELLEGFRPYGKDLKDASGLYGGSIILLGRVNRNLITLTTDQREHLINLYRGEITFVDAQIDEVFERLKQLDLWDRTLVVLNADHGEVFGEHGKYYHGHTLYDGQIRVPLIVKPPFEKLPSEKLPSEKLPSTKPTSKKLPQSRVRGRVVDGAVRNLDIMPTILDYCGIDPPGDIDGVSLRPWIDQDRTAHLSTCLETHNLQPPGHQVGYRNGQYKLIYDLAQEGGELYDLIIDPDERDDLLAGRRELNLENELRKQMLAEVGAEVLSDLEMTGTPAEVEPEIREQLKALGYID
jgi:arylsulfatase A-like enzyme